MTGLDWFIVAFCALLAVFGYAQGFLVGALSLVGFGVGAFLGSRLGPVVLSGGSASPYAPLFALVGALLVGALVAAALEGLGVRARSVLRLPGLRQVDGVLGAVLTACLGLGIAWIAGALALQTTGSAPLRRRPPVVGDPEGAQPAAAAIRADPERARADRPAARDHRSGAERAAADAGNPRLRRRDAAFGSVVRVLGTACGTGSRAAAGSAGGDLVVTNAHVVAGETDTMVEVGGNPPGLTAHVLDFDPHDDVAVLDVPGSAAGRCRWPATRGKASRRRSSATR